MAQISHLSVCLSAVLDRNEITVNLPKQTLRGSGQMLVISEVHSNKMLHENNKELFHLNSTEIFSNSAVTILHSNQCCDTLKKKQTL